MKQTVPDDPASPNVSPVRELLLLAAPTVAQMLSYTLMQFTDTWMLSRLGTVEPTAAGNGGMLAFSVISLGFGTLWVVNTLVSQAFGRGDRAACGAYLWQGMWFGVMYGIVVLPLGLAISPVFRWLEHEPRLASLEAQYLTITLSFTAVNLAKHAMGQFLLAIDRPMLVLVATVVGVTFNALANYALIFGHFGFESMGVAGAAWGTNLALIVELAVLGAFIFSPRVRRTYATASAWRPDGRKMRQLLKIGLPAGGQITADVLAWSLFGMGVIATFGTLAMTANTFMFRYMVLGFMPAFGLSAAVTALVGRYIGAGRPDVARQRAHLGFLIGATYMFACGVAYFVFRHQLIGLFTDDPDVLEMGATLMLFAALYQFFDAMYIMYNGALRGAGDTLEPAVVTAALCWVFVVGIAWLVATFVPQWGVAGPWAMVTLYGILLGIYMFVRFERGHWESIRIDHGVPPDERDDFDPAATEGEPLMPVHAPGP